MNGEHRHLLDWAMWGFAVIAGALSLAKVALILSCLAALVSILCGGVKLYDRYRYGPLK
jgi:hypothetical protein